jgi:hypothetical protein
MSVLLNISTPDSQLKKKNLVIAYHLVHENVAALVMEPFYILSSQNFADFLTTKQLASTVHEYHAKGLLYARVILFFVVDPVRFQRGGQA